MKTRVLYLVSHPIQYQAPLLRRVAQEPAVSLRVLFISDTTAGYFDPGFGREVRWDVPLRQGYESVLLADSDLATEISGADVIWLHGWQGPVMRDALRLAKRLRKPVLLRGENTDAAMPDGSGIRGFLKRRFLDWVFARTTAFLAIGSANRAYYRSRGVADERIFTMPYAVDNQAFAAAAAAARPHRAALREQLGLRPDRQVILFAGKLMPRKHPHTLLKAWRDARWHGPRPYLLFVGDGELKTALQAEACDGVVFAGFRNQGALPAFYDLADIFVLASECEPWGLAVNEAMACGTAVLVGSNVGCAPDLVDEKCGAIVPPGDCQALAAAMPPLLARAAAAGQAAARTVNHWDFEADVAGLTAAIEYVRRVP